MVKHASYTLADGSVLNITLMRFTRVDNDEEVWVNPLEVKAIRETQATNTVGKPCPAAAIEAESRAFSPCELIVHDADRSTKRQIENVRDGLNEIDWTNQTPSLVLT